MRVNTNSLFLRISESTATLGGMISCFLWVILGGAIEAYAADRALIPKDAPVWVRESPVQTKSGSIQFPVRISTEVGAVTSDEQFQLLLVQEIRTMLGELKLEDVHGKSIDLSPLAESISTAVPSEIAQRWIKSEHKFDSESEFGGVKLLNQWRLVEISSREIGKILEKHESSKRQRNLQDLGIIGFWSIIAISGCAAVGSKLLRGKRSS